MGKADSHKNAEVRRVLEPLSELAARKRVAVVANTHMNKGGGEKALYRFVGSIAFVAAARMAFIVVEDPDDRDLKLFLHTKNNLAPRQPGLGYRLEQRIIADGVSNSSVAWCPEHVALTADDALGAPLGDEERSAKDDAIDFLSCELEKGPRPVTEIEMAARAAGLLGATQEISQSKPFRQARKVLRVCIKREGFGPGAFYVWHLPAPCVRL
jgi:hypothetical protein